MILLCSVLSLLDLFSTTTVSLFVCSKLAGVNGGKVFNWSQKDWLATFRISCIKFGLLANVCIRSISDGLFANSRKCSNAFCVSVLICMEIFVGLIKHSFDVDESNFKFFKCKFISSKCVWLSCKCCSNRRSFLVDCRLKDFFIFEWCWLWCNEGRFNLFDKRRLFDGFDSVMDVEKKLIVWGGTGNDKFVVDIDDWTSSGLAFEEVEEVVDEELEVEDEDVVRFFFPLVEFEWT